MDKTKIWQIKWWICRWIPTLHPPLIASLVPGDTGCASTSKVQVDRLGQIDRLLHPHPWLTSSRYFFVVTGADQRGVDHTPYRAPGPRPDSGEHRYIFLLFKQTRGDSAQSFPPMAHDTVPSRRNFDVKQFVRDSDLELVGINFFLCSAAQ